MSVGLRPPSGETQQNVGRPSRSSLNLAMLTAMGCLDRAAGFEERAEQFGDPDVRASLLELAQGWRRLAVRAYAQDVLRPLALRVPTRHHPVATGTFGPKGTATPRCRYSP
jgi:hypothetical protein